MFESLSEKLEKSWKVLKGEGKITEINVAQTLKEVQRALVDADVNYSIAKKFVKTVKEKALGQNIITSVKPKEMMLKIVRDELVELMGSEVAPVNVEGRPAVILMSGLQGSGKTTFSGKLAKLYKSKKAKRPLLVAADVYRPAAIEQLKVLGESIDVPVYTEPGNTDPVQIARNAVQYAKDNNFNLVIVDTAGRLAVDEAMMNEIAAIKDAIRPNETLFVVDAMTGQDAVNTAKAFNDRLDFDGVILTKLDGDTRGGAALSIRTVVEKPIKFIGSGEKLENIETFNPEGMANRIMGNGDLAALAARASELIKEDEAKQLLDKVKRNKFDFNDFKEQIEKVKKLGNIKEVAGMIPGVGKAIRDIEIEDDPFKPIIAMIDSMTPKERENPKIIDLRRRQRIAKGSGTKVDDVNRLLKQFEQTRQMMRATTKMNPKQMMKQMRAAQAKGFRR